MIANPMTTSVLAKVHKHRIENMPFLFNNFVLHLERCCRASIVVIAVWTPNYMMFIRRAKYLFGDGICDTWKESIVNFYWITLLAVLVHGLLITHLKVNRRGCDQVEECNHIHGAHIFLGKIVTISYVIFLDEERELTGLERTASA